MNLNVLPPLTPELYVRSLESSLEFYVGLLGFTIKFDRPETRFAVVDIEGAALMLDEATSIESATDEEFIHQRRWNTARLEYPFGRGINFQITVRDIDALYKRVLDARYPVKLPMEERWYRVDEKSVGVKQFMVMDPDGFLLRFDQVIGHKPA